jgi:hypothetical protein
MSFAVLEDVSGVLYREGGGFGGEEEKEYQLNPELLISHSSSLLGEQSRFNKRLCKLSDPKQRLLINRSGNHFQLPLPIHIESHGGEVFVVPLIWGNHRKQLPATNLVKMVSLTDNGLKVYIRLIDELVPIKVINCCQISLTYFRQFLLQFPFYFRNAT